MVNRLRWMLAQATCAASQHLLTLGRIGRRGARKPMDRPTHLGPVVRIDLKGEQRS